eukprot:c26909_g1_i1 orf=117-2021(+)
MAAALQTLPSPWTAAVRMDAPAPAPPDPARVMESLSSSAGVTVAVVDANALITTSYKLRGMADRFFTVKEVLEEVRDPLSRAQLAALMVTVECLEPSQEALARVVRFARETGDLQSLSCVDVKLLALTFTLESQAFGTSHLRVRPPPLHLANVRSIQEQQLPGWGSNVPNPEEWEDFPEDSEETCKQFASNGAEAKSHILGLKTLNLDCLSIDDSSQVEKLREDQSTTASERSVEYNSTRQKWRKSKIEKTDPNVDGKLMVSIGLDASKGEWDGATEENWQRAVSRSTRRKQEKRVARSAFLQLAMQDSSVSEADTVDMNRCMEDRSVENEPCQSEDAGEDKVPPQLCGDISSIPKDQANICASTTCEQGDTGYVVHAEIDTDEKATLIDLQKNELPCKEQVSENEGGSATERQDDEESIVEEEQTPVCSSIECDTTTAFIDSSESGQSWMLRPISHSTVACITADFAMQNVLLQMGLRVLSPNGLQVYKLHRWVLKCQACNKVTSEVGRIFCPKCGNGGTLDKVSVTIGMSGTVLAERRHRINIRGTKYSLPLPKGGRNAITENPILREDQLPRKLLYPNTRKTPINSLEMFADCDILSKKTSKELQRPPIRETLAVFSGKRNLNDRRYARKH